MSMVTTVTKANRTVINALEDATNHAFSSLSRILIFSNSFIHFMRLSALSCDISIISNFLAIKSMSCLSLISFFSSSLILSIFSISLILASDHNSFLLLIFISFLFCSSLSQRCFNSNLSSERVLISFCIISLNNLRSTSRNFLIISILSL